MRSLEQFFSYMNDIDFPYVVLRNFENLPHSVSTGAHGDLDLLVCDLKHFKEIFPDAIPVYPFPRIMHKLTIGELNVYMDVRYLGDGYYPKGFEQSILETRELNPKGFYTPDPLHFRLGLVYHAVHHKNENNYKKWIGNLTIKEMAESLKKSNIGYSDPVDPSVGRFNQYWKGATATVSNEDGRIVKKQTGYMEYSLIENEKRILSSLDAAYFPKVLEAIDGEIILSDCGERLSVENLPQGWKSQLSDIFNILKYKGVQHRDIKPDNLMIKDEIIRLIDFGWARLESDPPDNPPACLGYPYKPSYGFDDNFSMRKVIKEFEYKLEESKCASLA